MHDANVTTQPKRPFKKKAGPTGHEAFLKALEAGNAVVTIKMATDGSELKGTVKTSDKYFISLKVTRADGSYQVYVINKAHIEMFSTNPNDTAELAAAA
jgi:sRNA-binding regulator protein Hfq